MKSLFSLRHVGAFNDGKAALDQAALDQNFSQ